MTIALEGARILGALCPITFLAAAVWLAIHAYRNRNKR